MADNALAYGFVQYRHLAAELVTTVGESVVFNAVRESAAQYTNQINEILGSVVRRTTDHQIKFKLPGTGTLQPLDGSGYPRVVREAGYYDVSFPIYHAGTAWGDDRIARALMTIEDANRRTLESQRRDADWMRRHIWAAIFTNTRRTYADEKFGTLSYVEGLANGDGTTYVLKGAQAAAADTHQLAQAAAISDAANPFGTIHTELMEHPSNSGPVVCYTATNLVSSIEGLTNFVPITDPDVQSGMASDRISGTLTKGWGDEVLGKVDKCWIVECMSLPSSYIIAQAVGAGPFVVMREYPTASLQGFQVKSPLDIDTNLEKVAMYRDAGFGVDNRVAAVVQYIGSGSYSIPSGYTAPLKV